jgi:acyl-CoA thioester hydrolase
LNRSKSHIIVRYAETDQMGVVHHANHALYLEISRLDWLKQLGFSYAKMEKEGIKLPVVSLNVNYKLPLYFEEEIRVECWLAETPTAKMIFNYEIYNSKNQLAATASTVLVFVDMETNKPMKCPEIILDALY